MEKQNKLVTNVLSIMHTAGILDKVLLIDSWCAYFYKFYFVKTDYNPVIKTRDIDFLVSTRPQFSKKVDLEALLKPLGFEIEFFGKGYMKLESDELAIEFLVPEVGRPAEKPLPLPDLKINAKPIRHLSILWRNPIKVKISELNVILPHPADYCIQKLVIASRRKKLEKAEKDRQSSLGVISALIESGEKAELVKAIKYLSKKEAEALYKELKTAGYPDIMIRRLSK